MKILNFSQNHNQVRISWEYDRVNHDIHNDNRRRTICFIEGENKEWEIVGESYCSSRDRFTKDEGRKISLCRALSKYGLSKDRRRNVWNQYFVHTNHLERVHQDIIWNV